MSRMKGRYVAQIIIEIDEEYQEGRMLPFEEIEHNFKNRLTPELEVLLLREIDCTRVKVDQQYADIILEEEDGH